MLKKFPMTADSGIELCRFKDREPSAVARIRIQLKEDRISNAFEIDFVFDQKFHPISPLSSQTH
jgi:hypothetical protein